MAARWKHPNAKNRHEQMLIRCALVAYAEKHGADAAARKFNCSIPCVYQWKDKIYRMGYYWETEFKAGVSMYELGIPYFQFMKTMLTMEDYSTYVIFE